MKRTPLERRSPLTPTARPARRAPLAARSTRTAELYRRRRQLVADRLERHPWCAVGWDGCTGWATDLHEPLTRARGGSILDPANTVPVCRACHDALHTHPARAEREGWLIPSHARRT